MFAGMPIMAYRPRYSAREPVKKVFLRSAHGNRAFFLTPPCEAPISRHRSQGIQGEIQIFFLKFLLALVSALPLWFGATFATALAASTTHVASATSHVPASTVSRFARGLLWKIDAPGVKPSYLFGTIHSDDPRVISLPESVTRALDASGRFVMEAIIDGDGLVRMAEAMYFNDGRTLEQVVGKKLYSESVKALTARGSPTAGIEKQKPWAVIMALSVPAPTSGVYLDLVLEDHAAQQHKPITGLETIQEQIAVFDELPLADQIALLEEAVRTQHNFEMELEGMIKAYLARDLASLAEMGNKPIAGEDRLYQTVTDRLLSRRNIRMADRLAPILKEGGAFIAVGAAHLPGDRGLLNLIEKAGYRVTPVY